LPTRTSGFSRNYPEQPALSDWTNHDDAITNDQALRFIDDKHRLEAGIDAEGQAAIRMIGP
jgi:hypothetical protein